VVFFSRSPATRLWKKGESSGHVLKVRDVRIDCDADALLIRVEPVGPGVCHEGYRSCFFRSVGADGVARVMPNEAFLARVRVYKGKLNSREGREVAMSAAAIELGIPKGSLQDGHHRSFLPRPGWKITLGSRSYVPAIDDSTSNGLLVRAQEMAALRSIRRAGCRYHRTRLGRGNFADVAELADWCYAKQRLAGVRWGAGGARRFAIREPRDLEGKVIATEVVQLTQKYLERFAVKATVEFSWGATEVKVPPTGQTPSWK